MLRDIARLTETYTACAFHEPPRFARTYLRSANAEDRQIELNSPIQENNTLLTEAKQVVVASCPSVLW